VEYGHQVNPALQFIQLSAKTGEGMADWYEWINNHSDDVK
jgi:Ni2+-binding GTPase involved in maturation of urease and hydrogenase